MRKAFLGGIHPEDKKELTKSKPVSSFLNPEYVVIPLKQHIGVPCRPLVKKGDKVSIGQKIGDGEGLLVPVHASVSGTVISIKEMPHPNGGKEKAIIIKNDYENRWKKDLSPCKNLEDLSSEDLLSMIREAGIVGLGGATFSTEVKMASAKDKIDTLIINGCECEPYITADDTLMLTETKMVLGGIMLLSALLSPKRVIFGIEDNKRDTIALIEPKLKEHPKIELKVLPTRYPQGSEKQLIKAVTNREVPPGKLPADVACAVVNVSTAAAVYQAVYEGMPLIRRIVSVTGEGITNPGNYLVPIGTPFVDLIKAAGGLKEGVEKVIAGGPMMGKTVETLDVPVIKGTGSILCLLKEQDKKGTECIRCGKCVEVCPMYLQPLYFYRYEKAGNLSMLEKCRLMDCMECGCCAYTCPGKLPLVERIRAGKNALREGR